MQLILTVCTRTHRSLCSLNTRLGGVVRCKFGRHARVNSAAMRVTKAPDGVGAETVEQRYPHRLALFGCEIRRVACAYILPEATHKKGACYRIRGHALPSMLPNLSLCKQNVFQPHNASVGYFPKHWHLLGTDVHEQIMSNFSSLRLWQAAADADRRAFAARGACNRRGASGMGRRRAQAWRQRRVSAGCDQAAAN